MCLSKGLLATFLFVVVSVLAVSYTVFVRDQQTRQKTDQRDPFSSVQFTAHAVQSSAAVLERGGNAASAAELLASLQQQQGMLGLSRALGAGRSSSEIYENGLEDVLEDDLDDDGHAARPQVPQVKTDLHHDAANQHKPAPPALAPPAAAGADDIYYTDSAANQHKPAPPTPPVTVALVRRNFLREIKKNKRILTPSAEPAAAGADSAAKFHAHREMDCDGSDLFQHRCNHAFRQITKPGVCVCGKKGHGN